MHMVRMEQSGVYVQFSVFQEAIFNIQYGSRPKYNNLSVDILSSTISYVFSTLRFSIELIQCILLLQGSSFSSCDGGTCVPWYMFFPGTSVAAQSGLAAILIVCGIFVLNVATIAVMFISASSFRKSDEASRSFSISTLIYSFFCIFYLSDIILANVSQFDCKFSGNDCDGPGHYVSIVIAVLNLVCFLPLTFLTTLTSPLLDIRRSSGSIVSVRADLSVIILKVWLAVSAVVRHIPIPTTEELEVTPSLAANAHSHAATTETIISSISILLTFCSLIYQLLQCPHTRDLDNRMRAGLLGVTVGMSIVAVAMAWTDSDALVYKGYWQAIAGVFVGSLSISLAVARKRQLAKAFQLDMNAMSANYSLEYVKDLPNLIIDDHDSFHILGKVSLGLGVIIPPNVQSQLESSHHGLKAIKDESSLFLTLEDANTRNKVTPQIPQHNMNTSLNFDKSGRDYQFGGLYSPGKYNSNNVNGINSHSFNNSPFKKGFSSPINNNSQNNHQLFDGENHSPLRSKVTSLVSSPGGQNTFQHQNNTQRDNSSGKLPYNNSDFFNANSTNLSHNDLQVLSQQNLSVRNSYLQREMATIPFKTMTTSNVGGSMGGSRFTRGMVSIPWTSNNAQNSMIEQQQQFSKNEDDVFSLQGSPVQQQQHNNVNLNTGNLNVARSEHEKVAAAELHSAVHDLVCNLDNSMSVSRLRLMQYIESNNFINLSKKLIFSSDMDLLLRSVQEDWLKYAPGQQEIAKATLLQLYAAVSVKGSIDQKTISSYCIWLGIVMFTVLSDTSLASHALKCASDNSSSWDTLFSCFLLQKAIEEQRNSLLTSNGSGKHKRSGGISDLASFRRWTSQARALHERSLHSLRRFFKQIIAGGTNRIFGVETTKILSAADVKFIDECSKNLEDSLRMLRSTDLAYKNLVVRYPNAPDAIHLSQAFKRQLFRYDSSLSANNSDMKSISTGTHNASSTDHSTSPSSTGSNAAESPKQQKLARVDEVVMRTFTLVRILTVIAVCIVAGLTIFFTMMNIKELNRVETLLEAFQETGTVFNVLPRTCTSVIRGTSGITSMSADFFEVAEDYHSPIRDDLQLRGQNEVRSTTDDYDSCVEWMNNVSTSESCVIVYTDGVYTRVVRNSVTSLPEASTSFDVTQITGTVTKSNYAWWQRMLNRTDTNTGDFSATSVWRTFGFLYDSDGVPANKYAEWPLYYAKLSDDPTVAMDPLFRGAMVLFSSTTVNDQVTLSYLDQIPSLLLELQSAANTLSDVTSDLKMTSISDFLSSKFATFPLHPVDGGNFYQTGILFKPVSFTQIISLLSNTFQDTIDLISNEYYNLAVQSYPPFRSAIDFCYSEVLIDSEVNLLYFHQHLLKFVSNSLLIVTVCALSACAASLIGASITIKLVRSYLSEFDRSDGVSPALAVVASLPRNELRRLARCISALRVDRGILDPDDEKALHISLLQSDEKSLLEEHHLEVAELQPINKDNLIKSNNNRFGGISAIDATKMEWSNNFDTENEIMEMTVDSNNENRYSNNFTQSPNGFSSQKQIPNASESRLANSFNDSDNNIRTRKKVHVNNFINNDSLDYANSSMHTSANNTINKNVNYNIYSDDDNQGHSSTLKSPRHESSVSINFKHLDIGQVHENTYKQHTMNASLGNQSLVAAMAGDAEEFNFRHEVDPNTIADGFNQLEHPIRGETHVLPNISAKFKGLDVYENSGGIQEFSTSNSNEDIVTAAASSVNLYNNNKSQKYTNTQFVQDNNSPLNDTQNLNNNNYPSNSIASPSKKTNSKVQLASQSNTGKNHHSYGVNTSGNLISSVVIDDSTSASTSRLSVQDWTRYVAAYFGVIFRRPVTRAFVIVWILIIIFMIVDLMVSRSVVASYSSYYDNIYYLMRVSFSASIVALHSTSVFRGFDGMPWRHTTYADYLEWFQDARDNLEQDFFGVINKLGSDGKTTVGRRTEARRELLYDPSCLSYENDCALRVDPLDERYYTYMVELQSGLIRAVLAYNTHADEMIELYGDNTVRVMEASNDEQWFFPNALSIDLEDGFSKLRATFKTEAVSEVNRDTQVQYILLSCGLALFAVMLICLEISIRRHISTFKDSLFLLQMIPSRLLDDYRVLERVLGVQEDEDEFTIDANSTLPHQQYATNNTSNTNSNNLRIRNFSDGTAKSALKTSSTN